MSSRKQLPEALRLLEQAIERPSFALGWFIAGVLSLWAGQPDRAIEHAEAALRLNPRGIVRSANMIGAAHLVSRRFEEAVPKLGD